MKELSKEDIEWMREDGSMAAADGLVKEVVRIAAVLKIKRETLIEILHEYSGSRKLNWQAKMWKSASTCDAMYEWAFLYAYKNGDGEMQLIKLKEELSGLIRKALIEMANTLPAPTGGKPPLFDWLEEWDVRRRVRAEIGRGLSRKEAYARVSGWYASKRKKRASAHTIRRVCEPEERERSRRKEPELYFVETPGDTWE